MRNSRSIPVHHRAPLLATAATAVAAATATGWATTAHRLRARNHELQHAQRDQVTGLLTRRAWEHTAAVAWSRHDSVVGLADLDHFKAINDEYGHQAGDAVLRTVATRLNRALGGIAVLGRYGGDELVFVTRWAHAHRRELPGVLAAPVRLGRTELDIGVSLGISSPGHPTPSSAVDDADRAMYQAKHHQRRHAL
ncbi:GGDEF domain-containing protein [Saccharopolyspora sp. NPDC049357]|uniref:GGDEF domain-containing protein n=1 Tax=Saccharopolyspora sp. NPDC049357 TaxID=3154507 RepID=UPI003448F160